MTSNKREEEEEEDEEEWEDKQIASSWKTVEHLFSVN